MIREAPQAALSRKYVAGAVGFEPTITVLETVALGHWATLLQWAAVRPYVQWTYPAPLTAQDQDEADGDRTRQ